MKKFKFVILAFAPQILGCNGGFVENRQIAALINMSNNYCNERSLKNCERYRLCMTDSYNKVKKNYSPEISIAASYILFYSPIRYQDHDYSHLMDNAYSLLTPESRHSKNPTVTVSASYFIYSHNTCASIIGDKIYNIDGYMPLLEKELGIHTQ